MNIDPIDGVLIDLLSAPYEFWEDAIKLDSEFMGASVYMINYVFAALGDCNTCKQIRRVANTSYIKKLLDYHSGLDYRDNRPMATLILCTFMDHYPPHLTGVAQAIKNLKTWKDRNPTSKYTNQ